MLTIVLSLQVMAAAAPGCRQPLASATTEAVMAQVAVCMRELREPHWQQHSPAVTVLGAIGIPALTVLGQCATSESDDEIRARCTRAMGLIQSDVAKEQLLKLAAREDLRENTIAELSIALAASPNPRALPLLARFVKGDDHQSHSAATALFEIDPGYYVQLTQSQQVAYALAIADAGYLKTHHPTEFAATAPALANILVKPMRNGQLALDGKEIIPGRWLLLLGRVGSVDQSADVVAMAQRQPSESVRSGALDLLAEWRSPLGLGIAIESIRTALSQRSYTYSPAASSGAQFLRRLSAHHDPAARQALGSLWRDSGGLPGSPYPVDVRKGVRCELVWSLRNMTPTPPATEVAELLTSRCAHDLTILLNQPEPKLIDGLVVFLRRPTSDVGLVQSVREALAWQCAGRLKQPVCRNAAPFLRGVRRPSHPD